MEFLLVIWLDFTTSEDDGVGNHENEKRTSDDDEEFSDGVDKDIDDEQEGEWWTHPAKLTKSER